MYSRQCGVCKDAAMRFEQLRNEAHRAKARVVFVQHNVETDYGDKSDLSRLYNVRAVPCFLFFDGGAVVRRLSLRDIRRLTGPKPFVQAALAEDVRRLRSTFLELKQLQIVATGNRYPGLITCWPRGDMAPLHTNSVDHGGFQDQGARPPNYWVHCSWLRDLEPLPPCSPRTQHENRVKVIQQGHQLQQRTGSVQSPISSLSYTSFREKLAAMCSAAGIKRGIMPHSMRIGGNSAAAARGVHEEARKAHGRWKTYAMAQLYTQLEDDAALEATRNLALA
ncbi:hypothetical protein VOLCADRAFT_94241 [Volvox carteri f. nagariensis]|uniref:Thioredoxin domain-containing protein n=1 Tax=Volvox carteri f. nagariensis TaxID=3068 RepID=D8U4I4_VOLCA|nr:uncharacterized protein VOLCADRAFT_94241 [Volvox carteri f. nagariensis]EFJ45508.1 hypothetical protein VOLCADRAFT_94241 [Volvox carteri f. nagariensis]|eukprot:XP_002953535.1 hypothetical protein VOLCADRAFT_94241 [Volvox carteri f. nagariensis]